MRVDSAYASQESEHLKNVLSKVRLPTPRSGASSSSSTPTIRLDPRTFGSQGAGAEPANWFHALDESVLAALFSFLGDAERRKSEMEKCLAALREVCFGFLPALCVISTAIIMCSIIHLL